MGGVFGLLIRRAGNPVSRIEPGPQIDPFAPCGTKGEKPRQFRGVFLQYADSTLAGRTGELQVRRRLAGLGLVSILHSMISLQLHLHREPEA